MSTDLGLTVEQIIEFYGARWKIEAGFREIKQEIGSSQSQTRNAFAVTNHLHFCMMATTLVWIYADRISHTPARRYATNERTEFAFGDVRRLITSVIAKEGFDSLCIKIPQTQAKPSDGYNPAACGVVEIGNFSNVINGFISRSIAAASRSANQTLVTQRVLSSYPLIVDTVTMSSQPNNRGYRFPPEIISHTVWLYHRFTLT